MGLYCGVVSRNVVRCRCNAECTAEVQCCSLSSENLLLVHTITKRIEGHSVLTTAESSAETYVCIYTHMYMRM